MKQLGPVVLSLAGIALTLATFWWLQRYLARRVPPRRVRKGDCPFCGYPVRGGEYCEGCGRTVIGECTTCSRAAPGRDVPLRDVWGSLSVVTTAASEATSTAAAVVDSEARPFRAPA